MNRVGKPERVTQNRVIALFRDELNYGYLGDWSDRADNSNIEEQLLADYLNRAGYSPEQISRAIYLLKTEAENPTRSLYDNNKAVYSGECGRRLSSPRPPDRQEKLSSPACRSPHPTNSRKAFVPPDSRSK